MVLPSADDFKTSPQLTSRRFVIPVSDLNAKGQWDQSLRIPQDLAPTLAVLVGNSEAGARLISATPNGVLRFAQVGSGLTNVQPFEAVVAAGGQVTITFNPVAMAISLLLDDAVWTVAHSVNAVDFDPAFTVQAYEKISLDIVTKALTLTNTGSLPAHYRVWGMSFPPLPTVG